jgi:L-lactate utilization protein LutB
MDIYINSYIDLFKNEIESFMLDIDQQIKLIILDNNKSKQTEIKTYDKN